MGPRQALDLQGQSPLVPRGSRKEAATKPFAGVRLGRNRPFAGTFLQERPVAPDKGDRRGRTPWKRNTA